MPELHPIDLRLPTPGCYADPDRSGLTAEGLFDGMTEVCGESIVEHYRN